MRHTCTYIIRDESQFIHLGVKSAVVVDIGGTTTDVGTLVGGFPREASFRVKVGEVQTNFRMPDVFSIGLGGGSLVKTDMSGKVGVGQKHLVCFTLTAHYSSQNN